MRNAAATTSYLLPTTRGASRRFSKYMAAEHPSQSFELSLEDQRVVSWRFDQFRLLGFSVDDAWLLVDSGADLQLARSLIGAGCPLHLALRIVL
jgi:hypothetical protein